MLTKCGLIWNEQDRKEVAKGVGKPASSGGEIEQSLKRLGGERIDLYQRHWPAEEGTLGDGGYGRQRGRAEEDPSPRDVLLGAVAIGDDRLETSTILSRDQGTDLLSHRGSMPRSHRLVNPLNASMH